MSERPKFCLWQIVFLTGSAVFAVHVFYLRYLWLVSHEYPNSTDGFYYLQEFRSLLHGNGSYYHKDRLFFFVTSLIGRAFSLDEVSLYYVIGSTSLVCFGLALAVIAYRAQATFLILAAFSLPFLSDIVFFRSFAFLKQQLSLSLLALGTSLFLSSTAEESRRKLIAGGLGLAAILTHKVSFVLGLAGYAFKKHMAWGLAALMLLGAASAYSFEGVLRDDFRVLQYGGWYACTVVRCAPFEYFEIFYCGVLALILVFLNVKDRSISNLSFFLSLLALLLNAPIWNLESGMTARFAIISLILVYFALPLLLLEATPRRIRLLTSFFLILGAAFYRFDHADYNQARPVVATLSTRGQVLQTIIPEGSFILAPHGTQFALTYFLGRSSAQRLPANLNGPVYEVVPADTECPAIETVTREEFEVAGCLRLDEEMILSIEEGRTGNGRMGN